MAQLFQVDPPQPFSFKRPDEWPKWIRRFERFRLTSALDEKEKATQVNALIYAMGDEADDIITGFGLTDVEKRDNDVVKNKFEGHFVSLKFAAMPNLNGISSRLRPWQEDATDMFA